MDEPSWIRDDVDTVNTRELRWSLSVLRSLTPEGKLEDVHLALHQSRHRARFTSIYMRLLEGSRPDLYADVAPKPSVQIRPEDTLPTSTSLPTPSPLKHSDRPFIITALPMLHPQYDLVLFISTLLEAPLEKVEVRLPGLLPRHHTHRVRQWLRSCVHVCVMHDREDLIMKCIAAALGDASANTFDVVTALDLQLAESARLNFPPLAVPFDPVDIVEEFRMDFDEDPEIDEEYFTRAMQTMSRLMRHDADALVRQPGPRLIERLTNPDERSKLRRAIARAFPIWNDDLERQALPLDAELLDLMMQGCIDVEAVGPSELSRTQAMAWLRLVALILGSNSMKAYARLEQLVAFVARTSAVDALTRCVLGTRLYLEGHTALAERALGGPAEAGASREEE